MADVRIVKETTCDACGSTVEIIDPCRVIRWEVGWVVYSCRNCGHVMRIQYTSGGINEKSK